MAPISTTVPIDLADLHGELRADGARCTFEQLMIDDPPGEADHIENER